MSSSHRTRVDLPEETVDLRTEVVPAVRSLLKRGLGEQFLRTCVRIGGFERFGGGFKSKLVGGLRIDIDAAVKLGDEDLDRMAQFVSQVNSRRPRTFPTIQSLVALSRGRRLVFMEQLTGYETLLDLTYRRSTSRQDLARVVDGVFSGVRAIARTGAVEPELLKILPTTDSPYASRLRSRLEGIFESEPELATLLACESDVDGEHLPPLGHLLDEVERWEQAVLPHVSRALCHGDLHLGNIMARRRGRGFSVRLIDPNTLVGVTDPLYDVGKLLHWAEPVGWAVVQPDACFTAITPTECGLKIRSHVAGISERAEQRRAWLETIIRDRFERADDGDATRAARLELAVASAHIGLAALLQGAKQTGPRRFALARTLRALGRWRSRADIRAMPS